jgi:hypothetical protein
MKTVNANTKQKVRKLTANDLMKLRGGWGGSTIIENPGN